MEPWLVVGLVAYSVAITLLTTWLVASLWGRGRDAFSARDLLGQLVWAALILAAGWLTIRYAERLTYPVLGYAAGTILTITLSIGRAVLAQSAARSDQGRRANWRALVWRALHQLTYVLSALATCLLVSILFRARVDPLLFFPLAIGSVLPGLFEHRWPSVSAAQPLYQRKRGISLPAVEWHSIGAAALVALVTLPLLAFGALLGWAMVAAGYLVHLAVDMARPKGILLLWPLSLKRCQILGGAMGPEKGQTERRYSAVLGIMLIVALFVADVGPTRPPIVVQPTYEQTLERYYGMRGRRLVYADVNGSWQASGRRLYGRFEVLNASGRSYVLLDTYTGQVFTGGRDATDHLYLDSIAIVPGPAAKVKPVEFPFRDEPISAVLPTVYEMQSEPGLEHIYVSGEVILALDEQESLLEQLAADYSQTKVRRFEKLDERHYRLSYVPAFQLIAMAGITLQEGELLVVATYESPPGGPTVTPLPTTSAVTP
jgi:membrane-bound metal-dependent hydrolase YbcI (DUF457 family)